MGGDCLPVAMVLITRWRKCIRAVRIAPDVIHTFISLWKSAQMFNMLEKMSQKPENKYGVNRITPSAIRAEKQAISVESMHIYQCAYLFLFFCHCLEFFPQRNKDTFIHQILPSSLGNTYSVICVLGRLFSGLQNCTRTFVL